MEPKSPLTQTKRLYGALTIDDLVQRIFDGLRQKQQIDKFDNMIRDLASKQLEEFKQCFGSRSRVIKLIL